MCAPPASTCTSATTAQHVARLSARHRVDRRAGAQHRAATRPRQRASRCCAAPGCWPSICAQARVGRRRRHPRQDHDHVDADADPGRGRLAPELRHRRRRHRRRHGRAVDGRRVVRRRGRRERRHPPRAAAARHDPHQRRGRPPRPLRHVRRRSSPASTATSPRSPGPKVLCADDPVCADLARGTARSRTAPRRRRLPRRRRAHRRRRWSSTSCATASGSATSTFRCAASTTCATRSARWPWPWSSASTSTIAPRARPLRRRRPALRHPRLDGGATLVDDYAHLPERDRRRAARGARSGDGWRRLVAVFQPNRYNRMAVLSPEYRDAFVDADLVVLTDIYPSGTAPIPGVTGKLVVNAVLDAHPRHGMAWMPRRADLIDYLARELREGDVCISMGCGDVASLPDEVLARRAELERRQRGRRGPIAERLRHCSVAICGPLRRADAPPRGPLTTYRSVDAAALFASPTLARRVARDRCRHHPAPALPVLWSAGLEHARRRRRASPAWSMTPR